MDLQLTLFRAIRWLCVYPYWVFGLFLLLIQYTGWDLQDRQSRENFSIILVWWGLLAEVFGIPLWFRFSAERFPSRPALSFLQPMTDLLDRSCTLNNYLSLVAAGAMAVAVAVPSLRAASLCVCLLVGSFDLPRLYYTHYWFLLTISFQFFDGFEAAQITLGHIYFWSGFGKVMSPDGSFYEHTVPDIFALPPVFRSVPGLLPLWERLLATRPLMAAVASLECWLGLALLLFPVLVLPAHVITCLQILNLALHTFILLGIGVRFSIASFVGLNLLCLNLFPLALQATPTSEWGLFLHLCYAVPPLLMLVGLCPSSCLSHSYFAPGWYGQCLLLLPRDALLFLPESVNGFQLHYPTAGPDLRVHLDSLGLSGEWLVVDEAAAGANFMLPRDFFSEGVATSPAQFAAICRRFRLSGVVVVQDQFVLFEGFKTFAKFVPTVTAISGLF